MEIPDHAAFRGELKEFLDPRRPRSIILNSRSTTASVTGKISSDCISLY